MSSKLMLEMANKYPKIVSHQTKEDDHIHIVTDENRDGNYDTVKTYSLVKTEISLGKIIFISLVFGILFFLLSMPETYRMMGNFLDPSLVHNNLPNYLDMKLVALHSVIFTVIVFIIICVKMT